MTFRPLLWWSAIGGTLGMATGSLMGAEIPLANPGALAADWAKDPEAAYRALQGNFETLQAAYQQLLSTSTWAAYGAGALLTVLGIARAIPGPSKALAEFAWAMFAPKLQKVADQKQEVVAKGFFLVAEVMRSLPKDTPLGEVVAAIERKSPEAIKEAYREWEKTQAPRPLSEADILKEERIRARARLTAEAEVVTATELKPTEALDRT